MMITTVKVDKVNKDGENETIGSLIGFEVRIYNETDEGVPQAMQEAMVQSRLDGSRRRVGYKVSFVDDFSYWILLADMPWKFSGGFKKIQNWTRNTKDVLGNFLF